MFHPPSLLFPHGHFDVRFPSSPAPPPAMTFPRSVSTPSSPRRATPPGGSVSGSLANLTSNTGYEPKYNVDDDTEITPMIYPDTDDLKLDFSTDLISDSEQTKFGSRQAAASAASTSFDPSRVCVNASTGKLVQRDREKERERERKRSSHCCVSELTHNSSVVSVERSMSWRKRDKSTDNSERQAKYSRIPWTTRSHSHSGWECSSKKIDWGWNRSGDLKHGRKGNSEFAPYESQRELESQRHQWRQASQWADQAQRDRISLCGELELKNRLYQENYTKCRQEFQELTQHRLEEHSVQQKRDPDTVSQLLTQLRELQDKIDFLSDAREFHDPELGSSSGQSHVPNQHRIISSSMRRPSCVSGAPRKTRDDMSIRGNVFEDLPAQVHPKEFFEN